MTDRDPRTDPQPGDVLRKVSFHSETFAEITVTRVGRGVVIFRNTNAGLAGGFYLAQFRKWARGAEVVKTGDGGTE